jgi:delta24-sterol reductase
MERHKDLVATLAEAIKDFHLRKIPFWVYHGTTNCTRQISFDPDKIIDTSELNKILEVDSKRGVVVSEPNVPMDSL